MLQEDNELLLKDLSARLSYGIIIYRITDNSTHKFIDSDIAENIDMFSHFLEYSGIDNIKPYLRPMSSMTEEERIEFTELFYKLHDDELFDYIEEGIEFSIWKHKGISPVVFDWLDKKMFDYRGLIPMGLALEAPEGMYNIKKK